VTVRPFGAGDAPAWDAYVDSAPAATFFHRSAWRDIIRQVFRHRTHYLVAERRGALVGVLPLAQTRSLLFGHSLCSLPFAVYGGPAADDEHVERALLDAAVALGGELGVDHLELRNITPRCVAWPTSELYVTFRKVIEPDVEANMRAIPRKQRAMVRKGMRHGLVSEIDDSVDRFFELYAGNMHRHGTPPLSRRYFHALRAAFGQDCEILTVIDREGRPVSSVLSFYFRDEVLPYYAGDACVARDLAANDFKYWELMRRATERGVRVFDYGRSKRHTGSFDFKKNWGFEPTPLAYEFKLYRGGAVPQHNPSNPKYRALIATWRRMPRRLANALGPYVVRNLG
jgi:FemAB-related protein (PEP-CTERM system-associated)